METRRAKKVEGNVMKEDGRLYTGKIRKEWSKIRRKKWRWKKIKKEKRQVAGQTIGKNKNKRKAEEVKAELEEEEWKRGK